MSFFKLAKNEIHVSWAFLSLQKNWIHVFWAFLACKKLTPCFLSLFKLAKKLNRSHFLCGQENLRKSLPSENICCLWKIVMKLVYDDGFASSRVCSYSGINIWCIYYHWKVSSIGGNIFFQNLRNATPPFKIFFPFQKYVTRKYTINYSIFPLSLSLDFFQHSDSPK